jgi:transcription elongation factor GreA
MYRVYIFSTVTVKNISNGCNKTYTLVNDTKADITSGKLYINTPLAKGLLGKKIGDIVCILLPSGKKKINFKILRLIN